MAALNSAFKYHLIKGANPLHHDILNALKKYPILCKRGHAKVMHKIKNELKARKNREEDDAVA